MNTEQFDSNVTIIGVYLLDDQNILINDLTNDNIVFVADSIYGGSECDSIKKYCLDKLQHTFESRPHLNNLRHALDINIYAKNRQGKFVEASNYCMHAEVYIQIANNDLVKKIALTYLMNCYRKKLQKKLDSTNKMVAKVCHMKFVTNNESRIQLGHGDLCLSHELGNIYKGFSGAFLEDCGRCRPLIIVKLLQNNEKTKLDTVIKGIIPFKKDDTQTLRELLRNYNVMTLNGDNFSKSLVGINLVFFEQ